MPLVSTLSVTSPARLYQARAAETTAPRARQRAYEPQADEQLFEPRSALGELLHALGIYY
jgi:hypothetical protein